MEGEYVIDVEPRCILDTAYWNVTVKAPVVVDLSWLRLEKYPLSNHTRYMPSGIQELNFPSFIELKKPPLSFIASEVKGLQSSVGTWPWWVLMLVALGILIAVSVILYVGYKRHCEKVRCPCSFKQGKTVIEPEPRSPVTPVPMLYPSILIMHPLASLTAPLLPRPRRRKSPMPKFQVPAIKLKPARDWRRNTGWTILENEAMLAMYGFSALP